MYILVPVFFALIQSGKDEWDKCRSVLTDKTDNPVIVPEIQCPLGDLPQHNTSSFHTKRTLRNISTELTPV